MMQFTATTELKNNEISWTHKCQEEFKETCFVCKHAGVSKSFRTGRLERELQMVQLYATRCSCIAILWVSLVSFAAIKLCVASQRVFIVVISLSTQSGNFWIYPRMLDVGCGHIEEIHCKIDVLLSIPDVSAPMRHLSHWRKDRWIPNTQIANILLKVHLNLVAFENRNCTWLCVTCLKSDDPSMR
jgi:hypothetical protein